MTPWHRVRNTWWNGININSKIDVKIFRELKRVLKYSVAMKEFSELNSALSVRVPIVTRHNFVNVYEISRNFFATEIVL